MVKVHRKREKERGNARGERKRQKDTQGKEEKRPHNTYKQKGIDKKSRVVVLGTGAGNIKQLEQSTERDSGFPEKTAEVPSKNARRDLLAK